MIDMPDINVMVALLDDLHEHHSVASVWFNHAATVGWALCPLTLAGTLRILSRPQLPRSISMAEAAELMAALIQASSSHFHFWPDEINLLDKRKFELNNLLGYRQISDLHLLAIANDNHGTMVSFDRGLVSSARAIRNPTPNLVRILVSPHSNR